MDHVLAEVIVKPGEQAPVYPAVYITDGQDFRVEVGPFDFSARVRTTLFGPFHKPKLR